MATCLNIAEEYKTLVKDLLSLNPGLYRDFDNVVKVILKTKLNDKLKQIGVFNVAHLFVLLHEGDSKFFVEGKAAKTIIAYNKYAANPKAYINYITSIYHVSSAKQISIDEINSDISKLKERFTVEDIKKVVDKIRLFLDNKEFPNQEEKDKLLFNLKSRFKLAIKTLIDNDIKSTYLNKLEATFKTLSKGSEYINITEEIIQQAGLDYNLFQYIPTGEVFTGTINIKENRYESQAEDGTSIYYDIDKCKTLKTEKKVNSTYSDWRQYFGDSFIHSALTIKPEDGSKDYELFKEMYKEFADGGLRNFKIKAIRIGNYTDDRINKLHELAETNSNFKNLINRQHETYESLAQINHLKDSKDNVVISVADGKASEQQFHLVGEYNGKQFLIYSLDNYVFVSGDNSTRKIDFDNEEDLEKISKLSIKGTETNSMSKKELTKDDLALLRKSYRRYNLFKEDVNSELALVGDTNIDVTEIFAQHYTISNPYTVKTKESLDTYIQNNNNISKILTIVSFDDKGNIIEGSQELRKMPFYFTRLNNRFSLVDMLSPNEKIKVINPKTNNEVYLTLAAYVEEVLGMTSEKIEKMFDKQKDKNGNTRTNNILLKFYEGNIEYQIVEPKISFSYPENFTKFILKLSKAIKGEDKSALIRELDNNIFTFNSSIKNNPLKVNFTIINNNLAIKVRPNNETYKKLITDTTKKQFNFPLNEKIVKQLSDTIFNPEKNITLKNIINDEKYDILKTYDRSKLSGLLEMYKKLFELSSVETNKDSLLKMYEKEVYDATVSFAKMLKQDVIEKLLQVSPEFTEQFKKDYSFQTGLFVPEYLMLQKDDKKNFIPDISYTVNNKQDRETFNNQLKNLDVINSKNRIVTFGPLLSKSIPLIARVEENKSNKVASLKSENESKQQIIPDSKLELNDNPDDTEFDTTDNLDSVLNRDEKSMLKATTWLNNNLSTFKLGKEDVSDIINLLKRNDYVLGVFKDRVIYLNKNINSSDTIYHEAMHGVFKYILDDAQRKEFVKQLKESKKYKKDFTEKALEDFANKNGYTKNIDERMASEILAREFKDYKINKNKHNPFIQKIIDIIQRIIDFFTHYKTDIEVLFDKVDRGVYNKVVADSGLDNGLIEYERIPGLNNYVISNIDSNKVVPVYKYLDPSEEKQLVNYVSYLILRDNYNSKSKYMAFDERFDNALNILLGDNNDGIFSLQYLYNQIKDTDPQIIEEKKNLIDKQYKSIINNYRFVLGARIQGENLSDINLSGVPQYDNIVASKYEVDGNLNGKVSLDMLKKMVYDKYQKVSSLTYDSDVFISTDELDNIFEGKKKNEDDNEDADEVGPNYEESFGEFDRVSQNVGLIRKFLSTIPSDIYNDELGIRFPSVIDADFMFTNLIKITANKEPENIISTLKVVSEKWKNDGYVNEARQLRAVYESLQDDSSPNNSNGPGKNRMLYNTFIDVLHGCKQSYIMMNNNVTENEYGGLNSKFTLADKVIQSDVRFKVNNILKNLVLKHGEVGETEQYKNNIETLITLCSSLLNTNGDIFSSYTLSEAEKLDELTNKFNESFKILGLDLPKSLIRLSLIAINVESKKQQLKGLNEDDINDYEGNYKNIKQGKYLSEDFFKDLKNIILPEAKKEHNNFMDFIDNQDDKYFQRLNPILRKVSEYIIQYDPTVLPSSIRNAEGKFIYIYSKYTPMIDMSEEMRYKGLANSLSTDPFAERLSRYMNDNAFVGDVLKGYDLMDITNDTPKELVERIKKAKEARLFLDNIEANPFGGVKSVVKDVYKEGKTYKTIDKKSLLIMQIVSFLSREEIVEGDTKITTFKGSFHQPESTNTNWFVTKKYDPFVNKTKKKLYYTYNGKSYNPIVKDLENSIIQEYNRIKFEWDKREQYRKEFATQKENNLLLEYNAIYREDGSIDTSNGSLRAYDFGKLKDFFDGEVVEEGKESLRDILINYAKNGVEYSDVKENFIDTLYSKLNAYAKVPYRNFLKILETNEIINVSKRKINELSTVDVYSSSILPQTISYEGKKDIPIYEEYPDINQVNDNSTVLEAVLYDFFYNWWKNGLYVNELFDGELSANVNSDMMYVKRLKRFSSYGSNMKEGEYKHALLDAVIGFVHSDYKEYGPYLNREEIQRDTNIISSEIRDTILNTYDAAINNKKAYKNMFYHLFDGQAYHNMMHLIDQLDTVGKVDNNILSLLIAHQYRKLSNSELNMLDDFGIVLNARKTVHAGRQTYLKLSESHINRDNVSMLILESETKEDRDKERLEKYTLLDEYYNNVYNYRQNIKEALKENNKDKVKKYETKIKTIFSKVHKLFKPIPGKEKLHEILNSIEYFNIDLFGDTTISKNATVFPIRENMMKNGYLNLELSSKRLPSKYKYNQVETGKKSSTVTSAVQKKLLITTDIINMQDFVKNKFTESEQKVWQSAVDSLGKYQSTLNDIVKSKLSYIKNIIRHGEDINSILLFKLIHESLVKQGASGNIVDLFEQKMTENGLENRFDINFPLVRQVLLNYIFAQYSNDVIQEKVPGKDYYHMSDAFMKVTVDENDEVIPAELYKEFEHLYPNIKTRKLKITTEINERGEKTYWVECIIPKPRFKDPKEEQFWMDNITRMFANRIPCEDKRSMIALKVVDFIDSSFENNIIVPYIAHILAGSDFDIDSLYTQSFAYYKAVNGEYTRYGDYNVYNNEEVGKFFEYINYMSTKEEVRLLIDSVKKQLAPIQDIYKYNMFRDDKIVELMPFVRAMGYTKEFVLHTLDLIKNGYSYDEYFVNKIIDYGILLEVLGSQFYLPTTYEQFNNYSKNIDIKNINTLVHQNNNLQAQLDLFTNETIFKNLYINQKSSTQYYEDVVEKNYGVSIDEMVKNDNLYTINNYIAAKSNTNTYKDGIAIAATMNKTASIANTYKLQLKKEDVIWRFFTSKINENGNRIIDKKIELDKFGTINMDGERIIMHIGNILGMFADGVKKPIPNAMGLNVVNLGTYMGMVGVGINIPMCTGFNYIPEIVTAANRVLHSEYTMNTSQLENKKYFNTELNKIIKTLTEKNSFIVSNLKQYGVIVEKENDNGMIYEDVDTNKIVIDHSPKILDVQKLKFNELSISDIGFEVRLNINGKLVDLSEKEQKYILLKYYSNQISQSWALRRDTAIVKMFKRLEPDLFKFDQLKENVENVREGKSIFTKESIKNMYAKGELYDTFHDVIKDMDKQFSKILIERTNIISPIINKFSNLVEDKEQLAKTIISFMLLHKFVNILPGSREAKAKTEYAKTLIKEDDNNIIKGFEADFIFTNNLYQKLNYFQKKYPSNKFLQLLTQEMSGSKAKLITPKEVATKSEKFIRFFNKVLLKGDVANEVYKYAIQFYNENSETKMFMKQLYYQELARTGLGYKKGSLLNFMPVDLHLELSKYSKEIIGLLSNAKEKQIVKVFKEYLNTKSDDNVEAFFNDMVSQIIYDIDKNSPKKIKVRNIPFKFLNKVEGIEKFGLTKYIYDDAIQYVSQDIIKGEIAQALNHVFKGQKISKDSGQFYMNLKNIGASFIVDMKELPDSNYYNKEEMLRGIGSYLRIYKNIETGLYKFPLFHRIENATYKLDMLDGKKYGNFGNIFIESIKNGEKELILEGTKATYKIVKDIDFAVNYNPLAYNQTQIDRYNDLINKRINLNEEYVDRASKAPINEETFKQEEKIEIPLQETKTILNKEKKIIRTGLDNLNEDFYKNAYQQSSKRLTFEKFKEQANIYIQYARAYNTDEDIIDRLKCL